MSDDSSFFRRHFSGILRANMATAFVFLLLFSALRLYFVLQAQQTGNFQYVGLIFIGMILCILVLLSKDGRERIGLTKPKSFQKMIQVFLWGITAAIIMGLAANYNFGTTEENWFVYISNSFGSLPTPFSSEDRMMYFLLFSLIGATFSPIGEELFYRGFIHEMLVPSVGNKPATLIDAGAFSLVHLAHFGIYPMADGWGIHLYAAFLWVGFLFLTCIVFTLARSTTNSIWGSVMAHAGYNVGMNAIIFFLLLP